MVSGGNVLKLTGDSSSITATTAATAATQFTFSTLVGSQSYAFHCAGTTTQATAGAGIGIAIQSATTAPTNLEASTPEGSSPLELAEGLIEALSIPMNASLLCQVSNCIEMKARAEGISFAEAHDEICKAAREHPPADGRWALWFLNRSYEHRQLSRARYR